MNRLDEIRKEIQRLLNAENRAFEQTSKRKTQHGRRKQAKIAMAARLNVEKLMREASRIVAEMNSEPCEPEG